MIRRVHATTLWPLVVLLLLALVNSNAFLCHLYSSPFVGSLSNCADTSAVTSPGSQCAHGSVRHEELMKHAIVRSNAVVLDEDKLVNFDQGLTLLVDEGREQMTATQLRRQVRWNSAVDLLEATSTVRRRFDHRAHRARLVGLYINNVENNFIVAVQPDRSCGRKFIFLDLQDGKRIGEMLVESSNTSDLPIPATSVLRGMFINELSRGKGYSKIFLAIWMKLCLEAGVIPSTNRINKPLLALAVHEMGFSPMHNTSHVDKPNKRSSLVVDVSVRLDGYVSLYSESFQEQLAAGFSATEMSSQRLVIVQETPQTPGKNVHIRTQFNFPPGLKGLEETTTRLLGGNLRLYATQGGMDYLLTPTTKSAAIVALHGRI